MSTLLLILIALCLYGIWEYQSHQNRLKKIPIRIHVNGSRGKSSVARLIAAGLRAGGIRTVAKTTGTLPRIIDPDGREIAIFRDQRANIIEQVKILKYIGRYKPEALVIECMAVQPEYQWFCEHKIVHSQIGVITNCRLDHVNEMGEFREQIAMSLSNTCPKNGVLFTSEKSYLNILKKIAKNNKTKVYRHGGKTVTLENLKKFGHIEHPANVGLSLAVCKWMGVDRETALQGMFQTIPDAGALRVALCREGGKELLFVNAMAANDPESTLEIWHQISERFAPLGKVIILLNSRADRQDRSVQLIEMFTGNMGVNGYTENGKPYSENNGLTETDKTDLDIGIAFDKVVLTGESTKKIMSFLQKFKIPKEKYLALGRSRPEKVYTSVFEEIETKGTILAIGNVGAGGLDIFQYFYKRREKA